MYKHTVCHKRNEIGWFVEILIDLEDVIHSEVREKQIYVEFRIYVESRKKLRVKWLSCVQLFATPWTIAYQASLSTGFSRQEYWSGLPCPPQGDLPNSGMGPNLLHCRWAPYCWATREAPNISIWKPKGKKIFKKTAVFALSCFPEMNLSSEQSKQSLTHFF